MAKISITLTKSIIGERPAAKKTVQALGLRKIRQTVEFEDSPAVRGAIKKVQHLLTVSEKEK